VRSFTLIQDEPASITGGGTGPTPTDYLMASVGMCENVIFLGNACLVSLSIDSLETLISGVWDMKDYSTQTASNPSSKPSKSRHASPLGNLPGNSRKLPV
jgi:hypothetical protein